MCMPWKAQKGMTVTFAFYAGGSLSSTGRGLGSLILMAVTDLSVLAVIALRLFSNSTGRYLIEMAKTKALAKSKKGKKSDLPFWTFRPDMPNLKHGVNSPTVYERFNDPESPEAKTYKAYMDKLIDDLGGSGNLIPAQENLIMHLGGLLKEYILYSRWIACIPIDRFVDPYGKAPAAVEKYNKVSREIREIEKELFALKPKEKKIDRVDSFSAT